MPIQKNNLTKPPATANFKIRNLLIVFIGAVSALALIILILNSKCVKKKVAKETVDDQIYKLSKKAESSNFNIGEKDTFGSNLNGEEEADLPAVDQEKLGEEYVKDLKGILTDLEGKIQLYRDGETIDVEAIQILKKKSMEEIVPRKYQNLHIELIFALDSIINGDIERAADKLEEIKNNI